ncbi:dTDP-4-dehydrorhamnose reductase [Thiomicrolovo sp. ZZH C-3]
MPKRILVTGADGQLGSELRVLSEQTDQFNFTFIDRADADLADTAQIGRFFDGKTFDVIINCAAYTAVDKAESEPEMANAINHRAVETLAHIAKAKGISLVHISTDYVFDGSNYKPYTENEPTNPQGVYGQTKLDGEEAMRAINPPRSAIIRTSWVYSEFGSNFVKTMLRLGRERDELGVIFDQIGTPTYARDLARVILDILPLLESEGTEVYHYSNEGVCSWYDFAKAIFELAGVGCTVNPIETKAYPTPATRPHYSLLNKMKIKRDFGLTIPYWRDSLNSCLEKLGETH